MTQWFALWLSEAQKEIDGVQACKRLGFEAFIPIEFVWTHRVHPRTRAKIPKRKGQPIMPKYLFVGMPEDFVWSDVLVRDQETTHAASAPNLIRGTRIPARPIGMANKPTRLSEDEIGVLASLSGFRETYAAPEIKQGDNVKILNPLFFGHFGRVDEIRANKARVIISMLGSMRPVEVPVASLEAA